RHTGFSRDWSSDVCSSDLWRLCRAAIAAAGSDRIWSLMKKSTMPVISKVPTTSESLYTPICHEYTLRGFPNPAGSMLKGILEVRSEERRVGKECGCGLWG